MPAGNHKAKETKEERLIDTRSKIRNRNKTYHFSSYFYAMSRSIISFFIATVTLFWPFSVVSQHTNLKLYEQLTTFTKLYGYVKYFHPSDEAAELDWDYFAIYGAKRIIESDEKADFKKLLEELFLPIAPSLKIYSNSKKLKTSPYSFTAQKKKGLYPIMWQHIGNGQFSQKNAYKSKRVALNNPADYLFELNPSHDQYFTSDIGAGIFCVIPLIVYSDSNSTFPRSREKSLTQLKNEIHKVRQSSLSESMQKPEFNIGNLINLWNSIQHFYPYFEYMDTTWDSVFVEMLSDYLRDSSKLSFLKSVKKGLAKLGDGHANISNRLFRKYYAPIRVEWIEKKMIELGI